MVAPDNRRSGAKPSTTCSNADASETSASDSDGSWPMAVRHRTRRPARCTSVRTRSSATRSRSAVSRSASRCRHDPIAPKLCDSSVSAAAGTSVSGGEVTTAGSVACRLSDSASARARVSSTWWTRHGTSVSPAAAAAARRRTPAINSKRPARGRTSSGWRMPYFPIDRDSAPRSRSSAGRAASMSRKRDEPHLRRGGSRRQLIHVMRVVSHAKPWAAGPRAETVRQTPPRRPGRRADRPQAGPAG